MAKCIVTPEVVTSACEKGSLIDGKCVVTPDLVAAKCEQGTFVGDECVEVKIPPATEPVNLDDGMKRVDWKGSHAEITTTEAASALRHYQLTTTQNQRKAGKSKQLKITEHTDAPTIRTGSLVSQATMAMARQVRAISFGFAMAAKSLS